MLIPAIIEFMTNLQDDDEAVSYIMVCEMWGWSRLMVETAF